MSLSWMVASPRALGRTEMVAPLCSYSRRLTSGLVAREKIGCSIDPMSSLGMASATSQMKKSWIGWRSGRRGERVGLSIGQQFRVFTHNRAFTQKCQVSCYHPEIAGFVLSHGIREYRAFTH